MGRKPHGRITIANSHSPPEADAIRSVEMERRAISELQHRDYQAEPRERFYIEVAPARYAGIF
jgi:hypothetical protein